MVSPESQVPCGNRLNVVFRTNHVCFRLIFKRMERWSLRNLTCTDAAKHLALVCVCRAKGRLTRAVLVRDGWYAFCSTGAGCQGQGGCLSGCSCTGQGMGGLHADPWMTQDTAATTARFSRTARLHIGQVGHWSILCTGGDAMCAEVAQIILC